MTASSRKIVLGVVAALVLAGGAAFFTLRKAASDPGNVAAKAIQSCRGKGGNDKISCYQQIFSRDIASAGAAHALALLQTISAKEPDVDRESHVYAHGIGIEAYQQDTVVGRTLPNCTTLFSSGCYHGVIQAYLERQTEVDTATLDGLCRSFRGTASRWLLFQCVHGAGHGLMMFYGNDLPQTLEACNMLRDSWDRESCYGGAFMENVIHATMPEHPASHISAKHQHHSEFKALDPDDLQYPCSAFGQQYRTACYLMQTSVILHFNRGDIGGAAKVCDQAPEGAKLTCRQSLGRDITSYAHRDPDESLRMCRLGSSEYQYACYIGAAKALVDWYSEPSHGLEFCQRVGTGTGWQACYFAVGEEIATLAETSDERAGHCAKAGAPAVVAECRRGARLPPG